MKTVTAIIPCYNEADRIEEVLKVLTKVSLFNEIIVVDDGSTDNTFEKVKKFPVEYLRNPKNLGKAGAMERGVQASTGEILFFCDADLKGLSPEIIEEIVKPVIEEKTDMFIGMRANKLQHLTKFSALLSGERALNRELWEKLPDYYKQKFRIEIGLNKYAEHYGKGFQYKKFENYFQTMKEVKYGVFDGFRRRILMFWDVYLAYLTFHLIHTPDKNKRLRIYVMESILSLLTIGMSVFIIGLGTRIGYSYLIRIIREAIANDPDSNLLKILLQTIKGITLDSFEILGVGLLTVGIVYLTVNIIAILRLVKKQPSKH